MAVNGVEIKVGQVWRSRCGAEWLITKPYETGRDWHWLANRISGASGVGTETNFTDGGLFWPEFSAMSTGLHDQDLLLLVSDPDIGTERRKQQEPNSPMRRRDDYPPVPEAVPDLAASPADFAASVPGMLDETNVPGIFSVRREVPADPQRTDEIELHVRVNADEAVAELDRLLQPQSALDVQIGGDHYRNMAIQPVTYIESNDLDFLAGNVVKYVSRHKSKNGAADVRKAIHYCQLILELQYGEKQ